MCFNRWNALKFPRRPYYLNQCNLVAVDWRFSSALAEASGSETGMCKRTWDLCLKWTVVPLANHGSCTSVWVIDLCPGMSHATPLTGSQLLLILCLKMSCTDDAILKATFTPDNIAVPQTWPDSILCHPSLCASAYSIHGAASSRALWPGRCLDIAL